MIILDIKTLYNSQTTVGKSGKAAIFSGLSVLILTAVAAGASYVTQNPAQFPWKAGLLVVLANVLLVFVKNLADKTTPNV